MTSRRDSRAPARRPPAWFLWPCRSASGPCLQSRSTGLGPNRPSCRCSRCWAWPLVPCSPPSIAAAVLAPAAYRTGKWGMSRPTGSYGHGRGDTTEDDGESPARGSRCSVREAFARIAATDYSRAVHVGGADSLGRIAACRDSAQLARHHSLAPRTASAQRWAVKQSVASPRHSARPRTR
jgi:hypothetical protein